MVLESGGFWVLTIAVDDLLLRVCSSISIWRPPCTGVADSTNACPVFVTKNTENGCIQAEIRQLHVS